MGAARHRLMGSLVNDSVNEIDSNDANTEGSTDDSENLIGLSFWIKTIFVIVVISFFVCNIRNYCPEIEKSTCEDMCFSGDISRVHLEKVTELGPRTAGSVANEILAPAYLRNELNDIVTIAKNSGIHAEMDEQISGYSSFRSNFHITTYVNLRNFILRFYSPFGKNNSNTAFLVNCHYDSSVGSPGASDAFVSCAMMLEISRIFANGLKFFKNDIIFLFNGAEESLLPASHAFITGHRWSNDVIAFLNLEGAGSGGRLMVFQTGPGESSELLMDTYSKSFKQPYANVFGEVLFQSNVVPSDTDYRIFRDFGRIPGIDMAYISDGYAYHTPFDSESRISQACLEATGKDILRFLQSISSDERLAKLKKLKPLEKPVPLNGKAYNELSSDEISASLRPGSKVERYIMNRIVYFDVLGYFFISIEWSAWKVFNFLFVFVTFGWISFERRMLFTRWIGLCFAVLLQLCSHVLGCLFALSLGFVTHKFGARMTWFSFRHNIVGIFILPILWWFVWFSTYAFKVPNGLFFRWFHLSGPFKLVQWVIDKRINTRNLERDFFDAGLLIVLLQMSVLTVLNNLSAYVCTLWIVPLLVGRLVHCILFPHSKLNSLTTILLTIAPPLLIWHVYFSTTFLGFFIPIMGRSGELVKPDIVLPMCIIYLISPLTLVLNGMLQSTSKKAAKTLRLCLLNICISYAILVHSTPFGFPYTASPSSQKLDPFVSPRYQRVILLHMDRSFRDVADDSTVTSNDSYVFVLPLDVNEIRYLKPNSYPIFPPASLFSALRGNREKIIKEPFAMGIRELVDVSHASCNRSLPYCGTAPLYPYIHYFSKFYHIPSVPHSVTPKLSLRLVSRSIISLPNASNPRKVQNLTFTVNSGPPSTYILIRIDVPDVRLSNWSFASDSLHPIPMPLPQRSKGESAESTGAHYAVSHIDASAVGDRGNAWSNPWDFWLVVDHLEDVHPKHSHIDVAVAGVYVDTKLSSSTSIPLENILSQLPPWVTTMSGCTAYEHFRFSLA